MSRHLVWSGLTPGQTAVLFVVWVLFWAVPALLIRRHAIRVGNPTAHYWFWSTIVLLGPLGVFAYWQDGKVRARKGELWEGER